MQRSYFGSTLGRSLTGRPGREPRFWCAETKHSLARATISRSIVISAGCNLDLLHLAFAGDAIDQPVLAGHASRPPSLQSMFERLGLAKPTEGIASDILNEVVDRSQNLRISS